MEYSNKFIILDKKQLPKLPKGPGVYAFKKGKEILYIGKAANIRERVKSHFQAPGFKQGLFISQIKKIGFIRTNSEIEALILEANLIKKEQPRFNVAWKDDKNYFYVGFSKEEYPRVFITHQIKSQKLKVKTTYPPTALLPFGQAPRQKCKSKVKSNGNNTFNF
jgi:excinuclease ABC subunit C